MKVMFDSMDFDGSGTVEIEELKKFMTGKVVRRCAFQTLGVCVFLCAHAVFDRFVLRRTPSLACRLRTPRRQPFGQSFTRRCRLGSELLPLSPLNIHETMSEKPETRTC